MRAIRNDRRPSLRGLGRQREAVHGLRNVLNTSAMNAHLAKLLEHDPERRAACLDLIVEECAKGSRLLQQLHEADESIGARSAP